ncbi:hypothetical protein ACFQH8_01805 [Halomicroarcula sp. GCM10025710]
MPSAVSARTFPNSTSNDQVGSHAREPSDSLVSVSLAVGRSVLDVVSRSVSVGDPLGPSVAVPSRSPSLAQPATEASARPATRR